MSKDLNKSMDKLAMKKDTDASSAKARRRLSVAAAANAKSYSLDGVGSKAVEAKVSEAAASIGKVIKHDSLSNVGYVPGNPHKVNQDRAVVVAPYRDDDNQSFWGVFDGHGSVGHEASTFTAENLPAAIRKHLDKGLSVADSMHKGFVECNKALVEGAVDCTFSGTTVITVYINNDMMYCGNAGDSRACLGQLKGGKYVSKDLSDDQKPERADEAARIKKHGGRVQACKGMRGEDIGPQRVWLKHKDVPGLAMTRSFGDLIAASVGVIPEPEVWEHKICEEDAFMILASDGVWEFITNQEAVDIVASAKGDAKKAAKLLTSEANKRWRQEEEVVDDITALIAYFK